VSGNGALATAAGACDSESLVVFCRRIGTTRCGIFFVPNVQPHGPKISADFGCAKPNAGIRWGHDNEPID
jgi:hypothetical protein